MNILLAGGTGLVGSSVIDSAAKAGFQVVTVGRRRTGRADTEIITDFDRVPDLPPADVAICTLGTTIAAAGSKPAFKAVDHGAVLAFARAALAAGIEHFLVVTAVGSNPGASVFYARVKGEVERDLAGLGFRRLDILHPGLLLGARQEVRRVERLLQGIAPLTDFLMQGPLQRYRSISATTLARALLNLSNEQSSGVFFHESPGLHALGKPAVHKANDERTPD